MYMWWKNRKASKEMEGVFEKNKVYPSYAALNELMREIQEGEVKFDERKGLKREVDSFILGIKWENGDLHLSIKMGVEGRPYASKTVLCIKVYEKEPLIRESGVLVGGELKEVDMRSFVLMKKLIRNSTKLYRNHDKYKQTFKMKQNDRILSELREEERKNRLRNELMD
jgi:hypothetical protein